jgi:hypothetical protein
MVKKKDYQLPRAVGKWKSFDDEGSVFLGQIVISKKQYFRLWAWYLSEGSGRKKGNSYEVKLAQKDPEKIINDLHELGVLLKPGKESVYLYGKAAEPFQEMFELKSNQKYIPLFIKESSVENIREFLDAFSKGDGTEYVNGNSNPLAYSEFRNETVLRTSSKLMADDLCELIVKAGWIPSVYILKEKGKTITFRNGNYTINDNCYNITICKSKYRHFGKEPQEGHKPNKNPVEVDYNGMVYDVELEKWHFLLVRRNGKCAWSGNCRGTWTRYWDKGVDALIAHTKNQSQIYDMAIDTAREEFKKNGIANPTETTPGFTNRVNEIFSEKSGEEIQKSLTWSGYKLEDRYKFAGFNISVENKKGSIRSGKDKDGHEWRSKMYFDYGYIRGTEGVDGDHVDVYIGPHEEAQSVYIVHQNDPATGKYDEDKVMLGFSSLHDARTAYLRQYDRPGFLGKIDVMPIEEFREKVLSKQYHGKMVKSVSQRVMELLRV